MLKFAFLTVAAAAIAVAPKAANADTLVYWSNSGAACVPADTAVGLFTVGAGSVKFTGSQTGTFQLYCPLHEEMLGVPDTLAITAADTAASGANSYVKAELYRMSVITGAITSVVSVTSVDSSGSNANSFSHSFDFDAYYYYVRIDVVRTTTSYIPIFYGVRLYDQT